MKPTHKWIIGLLAPIIFALFIGAGKTLAQDTTDIAVNKAVEQDHFKQLKDDTKYIRDRLDELNQKFDSNRR